MAPFPVHRFPWQASHRLSTRHRLAGPQARAFADYRYREELFPSSYFRMAYDVLRQRQPARAAKEYLRILHLAARESEAGVEVGLVELLKDDGRMDAAAVGERLRQQGQDPQAIEVTVAAVDLSVYDALLDGKEAEDGEGQEREGEAGRVFEGAAPASFRTSYEKLARQAQQEGLSFEQYLLGLAQLLLHAINDLRHHLRFVAEKRTAITIT